MMSALKALLRSLLIALLLIPFLSSCDESSPSQPTMAVESTAEELGTWFNLYFVDPKSPSAESYRGGVDTKLSAAIAGARLSVDMAVLDLNLWSLRDALVDAYRRGVKVRVVTESDYLDEPEIRDLQEAGIPVLGDRREGTMHNKFVVIDRSEVWTGSMNFTTSDGYLNDNLLLRVQSVRLAENYTTEFNEMFEDDLFGPDARPATPYPQLSVEGVLIETYFSPDDGVLQHLLALVGSARESLYFMAFSFTSDELAGAIVERAQGGVVVAGVMEETQVESNVGSDYDRFRQAGLDVRLDGNPRNLHHKVILIDSRIVVVGSYNFSNSAETRNDENVLVLHDARIAAQVMAEFERVFAEGHR